MAAVTVRWGPLTGLLAFAVGAMVGANGYLQRADNALSAFSYVAAALCGVFGVLGIFVRAKLLVIGPDTIRQYGAFGLIHRSMELGDDDRVAVRSNAVWLVRADGATKHLASRWTAAAADWLRLREAIGPEG